MDSKRILLFLVLLRIGLNNCRSQQIANYINNGSFEKVYNCSGPQFPLSVVKYWSSVDSTSYSAIYLSTCNNYVPLNIHTFQFPYRGDSHIISTVFQPGFPSMGYPRNRLKATLINGREYCVKFYVNIANTSPFGIDGFGAYFGGSGIDTISQCNMPLSYLTPQIQNPSGNVIIDTLNWVPITGTFTAVGDEKYMLLGNFLANNAVSTSSIGGPFYPQLWTDVLYDYASCIDIDLPAYAGSDEWIVAGDSAYIGRESDVEIDESCIWFKMTSPTASVTIDTIAGLWVKPVSTTTYVVRQQLWCSGVKWDTVVVAITGVGLKELETMKDFIRLSPNPTNDRLQIEINGETGYASLVIYNGLGERMKEDRIIFNNKKATIRTDELPDGVYIIQLRGDIGINVNKRFVVAR